jgi:hypothetical protein
MNWGRVLYKHIVIWGSRVHAQATELEKARSELVSAAQLYRVLSMPFWASRAETALAELG